MRTEIFQGDEMGSTASVYFPNRKFEFYEQLVTNNLILAAIDVWNESKIDNNNIFDLLATSMRGHTDQKTDTKPTMPPAHTNVQQASNPKPQPVQKQPPAPQNTPPMFRPRAAVAGLSDRSESLV